MVHQLCGDWGDSWCQYFPTTIYFLFKAFELEPINLAGFDCSMVVDILNEDLVKYAVPVVKKARKSPDEQIIEVVSQPILIGLLSDQLVILHIVNGLCQPF